MPTEWFYKRGEQEFGPVSPLDLQKLAVSKKLEPADLVRRNDKEEWIPAFKVKGLFRPEKPSPKVEQAEREQAQEISASSAQDNGPDKAEDTPPIRELAVAVGTVAVQKINETARGAVAVIKSEKMKRRVGYVRSLWDRFLLWMVRSIAKTLRWILSLLSNSSKRASLEKEIEGGWFYSKSTKTIGPVSHSEIIHLFMTGALNEDSLVCREAGEEWKTLKDYPSVFEIRNLLHERIRDRKKLVFGLGGCLVLFVLFSLIGNFGEVISGVNNEDRLADSLGMVVCGLSWTLPNGDQNELPTGTGTCFAVNHSGAMLTNKHVVEEVEKFKKSPLIENLRREKGIEIQPKTWVFIRGKKYEAEVTYVHEELDLSILKINRRFVAPFSLSSNRDFSRGTDVVALGFPAAANSALSTREVSEQLQRESAAKTVSDVFKDRDFDFVLTKGAISRIATEKQGISWVQHTADINPGNSGGPLVDKNGTVVAINTLASENASGVFFSLGVEQMQEELAKRISGIKWR